MSQYLQNKQLLQDLMQQNKIFDLEELSSVASVPKLQLIRLQRGLILSMSVGTIAKIARALQVSVDGLIEIFTASPSAKTPSLPRKDNPALEACQQEYQKLQQEMAQQKQLLAKEMQRNSLQVIESWLLQWPTAVAAVNKNPQLPATRLLSLVKPIEELLQQWQVESINSVGEEIPYNPQYHQLMKGVADTGDKVKVRYVGYKQGDTLLHKAKVSPVETSEV